MAVAIDKFQTSYDIGFEGGLKYAPKSRIMSGVNKGATPIKFGRFVALKGDGVENLDGSTESATVVGVAIREVATENNANKVAEYEVGHVVSYVTDDIVYMVAKSAVTQGAPVHVFKQTGEVGTVTATSGGGAIPVDAVFLEAGDAGDLVAVKVGKLLG